MDVTGSMGPLRGLRPALVRGIAFRGSCGTDLLKGVTEALKGLALGRRGVSID